MDNIVRDYFAPVLKSDGFKKNGRCFSKESFDIVKVLEIQSGWNLPEKASFTINLYFVFPGVWDVISDNPRPNNPIKIDSTVQKRIGYLMPKQCDKWWELKKDSDIASVGSQVNSAIIDYALPFLSKAATANDLLTLYFENPDNWGLNPWARLHAAIIANYLGDKRSARNTLLELLDGMPTAIKVQESSVRSDRTRSTKEKELSNFTNINHVRQCAERMAIDL